MFEESRAGYTISDDRRRLDIELIHRFLSTQSYWASDRTLELVQRSINASHPFAIFSPLGQVAFARVVTDYATFGWIADVFVLPEERGKGLSKWLMESILGHPELQGFRRWLLATKDAHGLYHQFGFRKLSQPDRWMERFDPNMVDVPDNWQSAD